MYLNSVFTPLVNYYQVLFSLTADHLHHSVLHALGELGPGLDHGHQLQVNVTNCAAWCAACF